MANNQRPALTNQSGSTTRNPNATSYGDLISPTVASARVGTAHQLEEGARSRIKYNS